MANQIDGQEALINYFEELLEYPGVCFALERIEVSDPKIRDALWQALFNYALKNLDEYNSVDCSELARLDLFSILRRYASIVPAEQCRLEEFMSDGLLPIIKQCALQCVNHIFSVDASSNARKELVDKVKQLNAIHSIDDPDINIRVLAKVAKTAWECLDAIQTTHLLQSYGH